MFKNWYDDYLRMIYPLLPEEQLEYQYSGKSFPFSEFSSQYIVMSQIKASQSCFERFKNKILSIRKMDSKIEGVDKSSSLSSMLYYLGDLKTMLQKINFPDGASLASNIFNEFENLISQNQELTFLVLQLEAINKLEHHLKGWRRMVVDIVERSLGLYTHWGLYWNIETKQLISERDYEEFSEFIQQIKNDKNIIPVIEYIDYLVGTSDRYLISRTMNLIGEYLPVSQYQQEIESLDNQLKPLLVPDDRMLLSDWIKKCPSDYYWWYYGIPKGFYLNG